MYSGPSKVALKLSYPRLLADIGGTHARFALQGAVDAPVSEVKTLENKNYASFVALIEAYLTSLPVRPKYAALAIAGVITDDTVLIANIGWPFSRDALLTAFDFTQLVILNDFSALAHALPLLKPNEYEQIGQGMPKSGHPLALIGPGTGLGVSGLIPTPDGRWIPLQSEGGHTTLAAMDTKEAELIRIIRQTHPYVSAEQLLSGKGLPNLYHAMATLYGQTTAILSARAIIEQAVNKQCAVCVEVVDTFAAMLGTVAGDLALTLGAQGGLYLGGGIIPLLGSSFNKMRFRARFEDKGQLSPFMAKIPTYIITVANPALRGVAAALSSSFNG
jgi:glucokinase